MLVLTPEIKNRRRLMLEIDRKLKGLGFARDIVVLKDEEYERDKLIPGTIARFSYSAIVVGPINGGSVIT